MRRRRWRGHLSPAERDERRRCWRHGDAINAIARALDRRHSVVERVLAGTGGFSPVPRQRSPRVLSLAEREEISRGVAGGHSVRQIAARLGRAPSTVCRELGRHGGRAPTTARRPPMPPLGSWPGARSGVSSPRSRGCAPWSPSGFGSDGSPEQIAGWLRHTYPEDEAAARSSHETIYRSLLHPGARGADAGAAAALALETDRCGGRNGDAHRAGPRPDRRRGVDPRAPAPR